MTKAASLREFGRAWAPVFGMSSEEMYGRQRILTDLGLIEGDRKSGPGRGARQTAWNTALLFAALLCAPSRAETEKTIYTFAYLRIQDEDISQLMENEYFITELMSIFRQDSRLNDIAEVVVCRTTYTAYVKYQTPTGPETMIFARDSEKKWTPLPTISASLPGRVFREVGRL